MKKQTLIPLFLLTLFCITPVFSQKQQKTGMKNSPAETVGINRQDFNGTWELDYSKTRFDKFTCAVHTKLENFSRTLFIEQKSFVLKTTEKNKWDWTDENIKLPNFADAVNTYFTDNRGEINYPVGTEKLRTKTKWVGDKLLITHLTSGEFVKIEPYATSEISLSENKNTLIWHYKIIADSEKEEEELKELETYLVFVRRKE